jgi:hypothetical protein
LQQFIKIVQSCGEALLKAHIQDSLQIFRTIEIDLYGYFSPIAFIIERIFPFHAWSIIGFVSIFITKGIGNMKTFLRVDGGVICPGPMLRVIRANHGI